MDGGSIGDMSTFFHFLVIFLHAYGSASAAVYWEPGVCLVSLYKYSCAEEYMLQDHEGSLG